jgi:hypothetical protein
MVLRLKSNASNQDIEILRRKISKNRQRGVQRSVDLKKYVGVIKLKEKVLAVQNEMRDEWQ